MLFINAMYATDELYARHWLLECKSLLLRASNSQIKIDIVFDLDCNYRLVVKLLNYINSYLIGLKDFTLSCRVGMETLYMS